MMCVHAMNKKIAEVGDHAHDLIFGDSRSRKTGFAVNVAVQCSEAVLWGLARKYVIVRRRGQIVCAGRNLREGETWDESKSTRRDFRNGGAMRGTGLRKREDAGGSVTVRDPRYARAGAANQSAPQKSALLFISREAGCVDWQRRTLRRGPECRRGLQPLPRNHRGGWIELHAAVWRQLCRGAWAIVRDSAQRSGARAGEIYRPVGAQRRGGIRGRWKQVRSRALGCRIFFAAQEVSRGSGQARYRRRNQPVFVAIRRGAMETQPLQRGEQRERDRRNRLEKARNARKWKYSRVSAAVRAQACARGGRV